MTKIVLNGCYGGFSLSEAGMAEYARLKGWGFYPERVENRFSTTYWLIPEDHPDRIRFNELKKLPRSEFDYNEYNNIYDRWTMTRFYDFNRDDPVLIEVVETLGEKANGDHAKLYIEELPSGTLYRIKEYDGIESIETKDDMDWFVA